MELVDSENIKNEEKKDMDKYLSLTNQYFSLVSKINEIENKPEDERNEEDKNNLIELKVLKKQFLKDSGFEHTTLNEEQAQSLVGIINNINPNINSVKLSEEEQEEFIKKFQESRESYIKEKEINISKLLEYIHSTRHENFKNDKRTKNIIKGWEKIKQKHSKVMDIRIRVSREEKEKIIENMNKLGFDNMSDFIRHVACKNEINNYVDEKKIEKYELSEDNQGLLAYFNDDRNNLSFYYIHSNELTNDQKIIRDILLRNKIKELENLIKN